MSRHDQGPDHVDDGRLTSQEVAAQDARLYRFLGKYLLTLLVTMGFVVLLLLAVAGVAANAALFALWFGRR